MAHGTSVVGGQWHLPPRQLCEDLESVRQMAERSGDDLSVQASLVSSAEWCMDLARAAKMREELALSPEEHAQLLERFRQRNRETWGAYSTTDL